MKPDDLSSPLLPQDHRRHLHRLASSHRPGRRRQRPDDRSHAHPVEPRHPGQHPSRHQLHSGVLPRQHPPHRRPTLRHGALDTPEPRPTPHGCSPPQPSAASKASAAPTSSAPGWAITATLSSSPSPAPSTPTPAPAPPPTAPRTPSSSPTSLQLHLTRYGIDTELIPTERGCLITASFAKPDPGFLFDIPADKADKPAEIHPDPTTRTIAFTSTRRCRRRSPGLRDLLSAAFFRTVVHARNETAHPQLRHPGSPRSRHEIR